MCYVCIHSHWQENMYDRAYAKMAANPNQYAGGGTKTVSMFSKLVSQGSSFVMEGVKNLVVKRHVSHSWKISFTRSETTSISRSFK